MTEVEWQAVWLTVRLALVTTLLLLVISLPLAWWLSRGKGFAVTLVESIVTLPLILPPTVLGYYLLVVMSPEAWLGKVWFAMFDRNLVFSFSGLVIGSILYSLPFVVQPIRDGFKSVPNELLEVAQTMGSNRWQCMRRVVLPLAKPMIITGAMLGFAHTIGEFGVVLLIGGNIAGETRVLSIALFDYVESLQLEQANVLATGMLVFSLAVLLCVNMFNKRRLAFNGS